MFLPRKIAVGLSMSESMLSVFSEATLIAGVLGAELTLAHAVEDAQGDSAAQDLFARQARDVLWGLRVRARSSEVAVEQTPHLCADPLALEEVTRAAGAEWLVLGPGPRHPWGRLLEGSITPRLVRESTMPVWVARPGPGRRELKRIVVAVDDSETARNACFLGAELARRANAALVLLAVGPPQRTKALTLRLTDRLADEGAPDHLEVVRSEGALVEVVCEHVRRTHVDLLVLGCAGRRGVRRLLRPNSAERLLHRVPCSLLSVPTKRAQGRLYRRVGDRFVAAAARPELSADVHQTAAHGRRARGARAGAFVGSWGEAE
mgnify:CR=1 FL=1